MTTHDLTISQSLGNFFGGAKRDARALTERQGIVRRTFDEMRVRVGARTEDFCEASPAVRGEKLVLNTLQDLRTRREARVLAVEAARKKMSWWDKLNATAPDYTAIDKCIADLEAAEKQILASGEVKAIRAHHQAVEARALKRLDEAEAQALRSTPMSRHSQHDSRQVAKAALLLSAASVPVSAWGDIAAAGDVYGVLREVNGNYAEMSDSEIWLETLMMPDESFAGLVSLTKGAYFETLVAESTGGNLFEHFNHPYTDIVIDGVDIQLKATNSVDYINSVPDHISVMSTSEVALESGAIDSGIALAEIERATELALGGTVIDLSDTVFDAALTGVGVLGLFATLRGVHHATLTYAKNEKNGFEAVAGGVGVAITGTAKSFVDTAEIGYKVINSGPSRFAGRQVVNLAMWSGKKIIGKPKAATPRK